MYLSPKQRKEIVLIHFTLWFLNQAQKGDLEFESKNKKQEKQIKELIAIRGKIINPLKQYINELNIKLLRKQKIQLDKQFEKLKKTFLHKMNLLNKIKARKGIGDIYVEFDFISYLILSIMYKNKMEHITYDMVINSEKLIENELSQYKDMSQQEVTIIKNFMKSFIGSFIED